MTTSGDLLPSLGNLRPYRRRQLLEGFRHATRLGASALEVARASVWMFIGGDRRLRRVHLYHRSSDGHTSGGEISADDYPAYFRSLIQGSALAISNVHEDPRTAELSDSYASPLGISAWLDAPVEARGGLAGVLRFEHVGPPRQWSDRERRLALDIASVVADLLETEEQPLPTAPAPEVARARPPDQPPGEAPPRPRPGAWEPSAAAEPSMTPEPSAPGDLPGEPPTAARQSAEASAPPGEEEWPEEWMDAVPSPVVRVRTDGEILSCNRTFAETLGLQDVESLQGRFLTEFISPSDAWENLARQVREMGGLDGEDVQLRRPNGATTWLLMNASLQETDPAGGETILLVGIDIREWKNLQDRLVRQAHRDPLTGAANRRLFRETADQVFAMADRQEHQAGLLYVDLRRFKDVNDRYGHEVGDRVLTHVADRLRARRRQSDLTARIGGDEFAVLLSAVEGLEGVKRAAERIQESLKRPIQVDELTIQVGATIGIAIYPDHGRDVRSLLRQADAAMYRAKAKDQPNIALPPEEGAAPEDLPGSEAEEGRSGVQKEELREALEAGELTVYFQPIFRLPEREMVAAEALLRWPRSDGRVLDAEEFVGVAEAEGLVDELDRWALRDVASRLHRWVGSGLVEWVSVNVSPASLLSINMAGFLTELSEYFEFPPSSLMIEVGLDQALGSVAEIGRALAEVQEAGVRVALDLGAGVVEPEQALEDLDVDLVKVDPALLMLPKEVWNTGPGERRYGAAVHTVAAKKIETSRQQDSAIEAACSLVQGRHLASPLPPEELEERWR